MSWACGICPPAFCLLKDSGAVLLAPTELKLRGLVFLRRQNVHPTVRENEAAQLLLEGLPLVIPRKRTRSTAARPAPRSSRDPPPCSVCTAVSSLSSLPRGHGMGRGENPSTRTPLRSHSYSNLFLAPPASESHSLLVLQCASPDDLKETALTQFCLPAFPFRAILLFKKRKKTLFVIGMRPRSVRAGGPHVCQKAHTLHQEESLGCAEERGLYSAGVLR